MKFRIARNVLLASTLLLGTATVTGCAQDETAVEQGEEQFATETDALGGAHYPLDDELSAGSFEVLEGEGGWYFNFKAANGEIILTSEMYASKSNAERGTEALTRTAVDPKSLRVEVNEEARTNGQQYAWFNVVAANGEIVGTSEMYDSKSNAARGGESLRRNVIGLLRAEAEADNGVRFEIFKGEGTQPWRFRFVAANHEIMLASEGYTRKSSAERGIDSVYRNGKDILAYEINESTNGQFYFLVVAGNGEPVGVSETYAERSGAVRAAERVQEMLASEALFLTYED